MSCKQQIRPNALGFLLNENGTPSVETVAILVFVGLAAITIMSGLAFDIQVIADDVLNRLAEAYATATGNM